jgi:hypothetical protein
MTPIKLYNHITLRGEENIIKKMNNFVDMCFESDIIEGKKD